MDSAKVSAGKPKTGGAVFAAPVGTELPTSVSDTLDSAFGELGYVSEDGVINTNSPESEEVKAWGGDTVLVIQTAKPDTFQFKLIEILNLNVLKFVYGDENITGTIESGLTVKANSKDPVERALVIDMALKGGVLKRVVIPRAKISELGEITYADSDAVGYDATVTCVPDANENTHYEYIKNPSATITHTVTFSSNGGSAVASQTVADGGKATKPEDPTKDGYTFDDWYLPTDLSTPYNFDTTVTADITLYAKWTEN